MTNSGREKHKVANVDYVTFLASVKSRIQTARIVAGRSVNRELILLYWDIGQAIVEKQRIAQWGDSVVEQIAVDLRREFPDMRGFSKANIWRMRQLYEIHSQPEILAQLVRELSGGGKTNAIWGQLIAGLGGAIKEQAAPKIIHRNVQSKILRRAVAELDNAILAQVARELVSLVPWGHHVRLLGQEFSPAARLYYICATAQLGWSRAVLLNQIKAGAYERARIEKKTNNFNLVLPEHFAEQAEESLKSRYNLEFLGIGRAMRERELEDNLVARLQQFILELGYGFCFVGRQHRLTLGDKEYFVDLLFYHRFLKALVAFDLKVGSFEPEHAGKMDFYLNLLNDRERAPDDTPSIGIVLCAEKDAVEVEFALKTKMNPIGVAEYQLQTKLPGEFKGKIPSAKQLSDAVRHCLPMNMGKRK